MAASPIQRQNATDGGADPDASDAFWKETGVRPIKIPPHAPMANAFVESYIGKMKQEVLNHFICFIRGQLDYIIRGYNSAPLSLSFGRSWKSGIDPISGR